MNSKRSVIILSIVSIVLITQIQGFVLSPYKDINEPAFKLGYRYDTNKFSGRSDANPNATLTRYEMGFGFKTLAYEMQIIPVTSTIVGTGESESNTLVFHNLRWQVFKDVDYGIFRRIKPGFQVGMLNLGLTSGTQKDSGAFSSFLPGYYYMGEIHLFSNPRVNLYFGQTISAEKQRQGSIAIAELQYNENKLFVEYGYKQLYIGFKAPVMKQITIAGAVNVLRKDLKNNNKFFPEVMLKAEIKNFFSTSNKPKKKHYPLKIDRYTFHYMEKGLLTFYEEEYLLSVKYYEKVLRKYPYFGLAHLRLGNAYYQLKNYELAKRHWRRALKYKVRNPKEVLRYIKKIQNSTAEVEAMNKNNSIETNNKHEFSVETEFK
jgi:tetratricopeptide (TPR) repeat protein